MYKRKAYQLCKSTNRLICWAGDNDQLVIHVAPSEINLSLYSRATLEVDLYRYHTLMLWTLLPI